MHGDVEFYGTPDDAESIATIHRAIELRIDFFDTADMCGPSRTKNSSVARSPASAIE